MSDIQRCPLCGGKPTRFTGPGEFRQVCTDCDLPCKHWPRISNMASALQFIQGDENYDALCDECHNALEQARKEAE